MKFLLASLKTHTNFQKLFRQPHQILFWLSFALTLVDFFQCTFISFLYNSLLKNHKKLNKHPRCPIIQ